MHVTGDVPRGSSGPRSVLEVRATALPRPFGLGAVEGGAAADLTFRGSTTARSSVRAAPGAAATAAAKAVAGAGAEYFEKCFMKKKNSKHVDIGEMLGIGKFGGKN